MKEKVFKIFLVLVALALILTLRLQAEESEQFEYSVTNTRDPMMPLVTSDGYLVNLEPESKVTDIMLEGIIFDPEGVSFAMINGMVVSRGEYVGGFKVLIIEKDKIVLQNQDNMHIIPLRKEEGQ